MTDEQLQSERIRIGQRIKQLRETAKLTQDQLAEKTGMQRSHIARVEGGKYNFGIDILNNIAKALNKNFDFSEQ